MSIVSYLYLAVLVVVVVHRLYCKVGVSIDYFPPLATCVEPSDTLRAIPCRVGFLLRSGPAPFLQVLCLKYHQQWSLFFEFWEATKGNSNTLYCFGSLLGLTDQQLEGIFPMPVTVVFIDSLWLLGATLSSHVAQPHLNHICYYIIY